MTMTATFNVALFDVRKTTQKWNFGIVKTTAHESLLVEQLVNTVRLCPGVMDQFLLPRFRGYVSCKLYSRVQLIPCCCCHVLVDITVYLAILST